MSIFSHVSGLRPAKTAFHPAHSNTTTMTFGEIVPVFAIEMLPGDVFNLDMQVVGRLASSMRSPILGQMDIVVEAFFGPHRLLMGSDANFDTPVGERNFEDVWKGGKDGNEELEFPLLGIGTGSVAFGPDGIMDSLGEQIINPDGTETRYNRDLVPHCLVHRLYRWIWNEFYRNEFLMDEIQVCQYTGDGSSSDDTGINSVDYDKVLYRLWRRDYFTSALPFQQFGDAPAFQLDGVLPIDFNYDDFSFKTENADLGDLHLFVDSGGVNDVNRDVYAKPSGSWPVTSSGDLVISGLKGSVNLNDAVTFDISDIRTAFQLQKWKERNARAGVRYTELLQSHFGVTPGDYRLQRPYFINAFRAPWIVSEVLQTSSSTESSPQGNQAGQSICLSRGSLGKFRAYEYGYLLIVASVVPKAQYQQGLSRHFSRRTKFDLYSPEFAHLSEQAILNKEIFVSGDTEVDNAEFGFTGIWNEFRYLPSRVSRHMRTNAQDYSFDYWHFARYFQETPKLNADFLTIAGNAESLAELMRVFDVQDEHPFIVNFGLNLKASRPMPYEATPGLVDHF